MTETSRDSTEAATRATPAGSTAAIAAGREAGEEQDHRGLRPALVFDWNPVMRARA